MLKKTLRVITIIKKKCSDERKKQSFAPININLRKDVPWLSRIGWLDASRDKMKGRQSSSISDLGQR